MEQRFVTNSEAETIRLAKRLAATLAPGGVIAFRGNLGAGKTAFVRGLAEGLGIEADVSSPTFALVHEYRSPGSPVLYHFDMYRVTDEDSLYSTGFYDYLEGDGILAIEWSERIPYALPEETITVTMLPTGETRREIIITGGRTL